MHPLKDLLKACGLEEQQRWAQLGFEEGIVCGEVEVLGVPSWVV